MNVGSLFAGIGGIDLAFKQADFDISWANEIDKDACKTYKHNFPDCTLFECDVRDLDADKLSDIDIITAGFPCQPFSVCGKQAGFKDGRGNSFFEIMRIVDAKKPKIIFLENVANLVEHDKGRTFNIIHNELISRDYIIRYTVVDACDYGIPQHRTRTYIAAFENETIANCFAFPEKTGKSKTITDVIDRTVQVDDAYYLDKRSKEFSRLSSFITDEKQLYRFSDYGIQVSKEGISFTLKANMGTWYNRVPMIKDCFGIRKITPYDCLALQGFPNDYKFANISENSKYKQSGNSVVVPLIQKIAEKLQLCINLGQGFERVT